LPKAEKRAKDSSLRSRMTTGRSGWNEKDCQFLAVIRAESRRAGACSRRAPNLIDSAAAASHRPTWFHAIPSL